MNVNLNSVTGIPHIKTPLDYGVNETVLVVLVGVIVGFYVLFASLGSSGNSGSSSSFGLGSSAAGFSGTTGSSSSKSSMEIIIWAIFVVLIILNGMSYFFNIDITAGIKNLFSNHPEVDVLVNQDSMVGETDDNYEDEGGYDNTDNIPEIMSGEQVFHVPGNKYTYDDAGAICDAYGGRLANYKEVEDAYSKGGDWCSFGWSAEQMALYPTQYEKWQNLQKIKGHEHDCGRPGINGGYIANKNVRFGVNCFGHKPKITPEETAQMNDSSIYPKTRDEIQFENKVEKWRTRLPNILVAPFNHNNWSII